MTVISYYVIKYTRFGIRLWSVREDYDTASSVGINARRIQSVAITLIGKSVEPAKRYNRS
ncbi:MAG: ABC transporter permease subunit [Mahellales bacterium]